MSPVVLMTAALALTACGAGSDEAAPTPVSTESESTEPSPEPTPEPAPTPESTPEPVPTPEPEASPATSEPPAPSGIPSPSADQGVALVAALDSIAPGLASEPADTVDNARNICTSLTGTYEGESRSPDDPAFIESTTMRLTGDGVDGLTPDQAVAINNLIAAEAWCTP